MVVNFSEVLTNTAFYSIFVSVSWIAGNFVINRYGLWIFALFIPMIIAALSEILQYFHSKINSVTVEDDSETVDVNSETVDDSFVDRICTNLISCALISLFFYLKSHI